MGDRLYLRHGRQPRTERVVDGFQGFLFQIEVSEIVVDEPCEPDAVVDFLDADALAGEDDGEVDFLAVKAEAAAIGDEHVAVVEGTSEFRSRPWQRVEAE